jgi:hypothetical protein
MKTPGKCTDSRGQLTDHLGEGWLVSPKGRQTWEQCRAHGEESVAKYRRVFGEEWSWRAFERVEAKNRYAVVMGRKGGQARSEAKTRAARANAWKRWHPENSA